MADQRVPPPSVAVMPLQKGSDIFVSIVCESGTPAELKRYLFERTMRRFHELIKGAAPEPIDKTPLQETVERMNKPLEQMCPLMPREFLYDLLGFANKLIEDVMDKGWLFSEAGIWHFDKKAEVIHVDFGRKL